MRTRTFKFKSAEWFDDVVVTIVVKEHDTGRITIDVYDPKRLVSYVEELHRDVGE
jgi:hypothetical protein